MLNVNVFQTPFQTEQDRFEAWLSSAKPGERYVYAVSTFLELKNLSPETKHTAQLVRQRFSEGLIEMVQRRVAHEGNKCFEYWAIKRRQVIPPTVHGFKWVARISKGAEVRKPRKKTDCITAEEVG